MELQTQPELSFKLTVEWLLVDSCQTPVAQRRKGAGRNAGVVHSHSSKCHSKGMQPAPLLLGECD